MIRKEDLLKRFNKFFTDYTLSDVMTSSYIEAKKMYMEFEEDDETVPIVYPGKTLREVVLISF